MRLVLIRHGQTPSNVLGLLDTQPPGPGLTDLGREQAEALLGTLANEPIAAVYASTATRAQQTAAPLAGRSGLEIQVRSGLREVPAGNWEMLGDENSVQGFLGVIGRWLEGSLDERTPGPAGESGREVLQRFDDVVAEVVSSGVEAAALVAHGAINRFWASVRADNLDDEYGATHPLRNTGVVILDGDLASGWTARSWTGAGLGGAGAGSVDATAVDATAVGTHRKVGAPETPLGPAWPAGPADEDPFDEKIPVPGQP
jgi:broad specificity phosphatase PhoE